MELTLKYYHYFGESEKDIGYDLNTSHSWDVLRTKEGIQGLYYIPEERERWQRISLNDEALRLKAKDIVELVHLKVDCIHSFGVGAAYLEYLIKIQEPSLRLKCSDFAPQGIERLKKIFPEADEIVNFDMMNGDWRTIEPQNLCLLYRVDTVFNDNQWRDVLRKMKEAGIKDILFIPSDILTFKKILYQQCKYIVFRILRRKMTFSGFLRTKERFVPLLSEFYDIVQVADVGDLTGFLLKLRTGAK